jgi:hypothetical protein
MYMVGTRRENEAVSLWERNFLLKLIGLFVILLEIINSTSYAVVLIMLYPL